ncbi:EF0163 family protein [Enterococcus sp. 5B3_DIV0040]|uniref:EF0163 family protein n=1 Tax=Enterococcus sp. 5B3_DIV0040 TaxID=1834182 RepID=UPI000B6F8649|nr:EF0163 family protein [Enterococcus sp. 5B3_DIV0040]OTO01249.1 hypothetical protein A5883_003566 [Enterococcus sp. 5B3_DIV0040]
MRLVVSCLCLIGLSGCGWFSPEEKETTATVIEETTEDFMSETQASDLEEPSQETIKSFLKDFGKKWSNFTDVYKRNQSVREYMTERCIQDNGIDVDPHVQAETNGRIYQITQDMEQLDHYLLFGEETMNDVTRLIVLQVKVIPNEPKIDQLKVYYVRSAY